MCMRASAVSLVKAKVTALRSVKDYAFASATHRGRMITVHPKLSVTNEATY